jgi:hypothetical protein
MARLRDAVDLRAALVPAQRLAEILETAHLDAPPEAVRLDAGLAAFRFELAPVLARSRDAVEFFDQRAVRQRPAELLTALWKALRPRGAQLPAHPAERASLAVRLDEAVALAQVSLVQLLPALRPVLGLLLARCWAQQVLRPLDVLARHLAQLLPVPQRAPVAESESVLVAERLMERWRLALPGRQPEERRAVALERAEALRLAGPLVLSSRPSWPLPQRLLPPQCHENAYGLTPRDPDQASLSESFFP